MSDRRQRVLRTALAGALAAAVLPAAAQDQADVAKTKAFLEKYTGHPSPFPVTEPLLKKPTGKKVAILDCGTPFCGLLSDAAEAPAKDLGIKLTRIKAGMTAEGVAAAFDTVLEGRFDGVFVPAFPPALWDRYLDKLNANHIAVVASGVIGLNPAKVPVRLAAEPSNKLAAQIMADWAVARDGSKLDTVFYMTPELSFTGLLANDFVDAVKDVCQPCKVRIAQIPVATFGNRAPSIVIDDLEAHPKTTSAVFAVGEQAIALAPALKTADIKMPIMLNAPDPSELNEIKDGVYAAGLGSDPALFAWMAMDALARMMTGQEPAKGELDDDIVFQVLYPGDIKGDVSRGWTGYPDIAERFKALWADAK